MDHKNLIYLSFVLLIGILVLWGCPKKAEVTIAPETETEKTPPAVASAPAKEAPTVERY